jgi:membrane protease YdiL (CAAX protease family)
VLTVVVVALLFAAPYFMWVGDPRARYVIADAAILFVLSLTWRWDVIERAGLAVPRRAWVPVLLVLIVGAWTADGVVGRIEQQFGVEVSGHRPLFSLSQVFHQELVLRGLLLGALATRVRSQLRLAVVVAAAFAALHPLLFFLQGGLVLPITVIASLFWFGLATNWIFLRTGHIAFAFAMHAAWNVRRFGARYGDLDGDNFMTEAESFAVIEGAWLAVGAAFLLAVGAFCLPVLVGVATRFRSHLPRCRMLRVRR